VTTDGIVVIAPEILSRSILPSGLKYMDFRKSYEIAERAALDAVTAKLSVRDLKQWLRGADERLHLNDMAMCTAGRRDNETTFHDLRLATQARR
jgi:hypothetical protein